MSRPVQVCTAGECGGECYRCRLKTCGEAKQRYARLLVELVDRCMAQGSFGPFHDAWQASADWQALWSELDDLKALTGATTR